MYKLNKTEKTRLKIILSLLEEQGKIRPQSNAWQCCYFSFIRDGMVSADRRLSYNSLGIPVWNNGDAKSLRVLAMWLGDGGSSISGEVAMSALFSRFYTYCGPLSCSEVAKLGKKLLKKKKGTSLLEGLGYVF